MATPVFINELLNFTIFYSKRVTKSQLCDVVASFYHEDELFASKSLLCQTVASSGNTIDGWSKFVNSKGAPIHRKGDGVVRRAAEADDIVSMITVLDANGVPLPTFASVDLSRVPPPLIPTVNNNTVMGDVAKSLEAIVKRLDALESRRTSPVMQGFDFVSGQQVEAQEFVSNLPTLSSDGATQSVFMPAANVMPPADQVQVQVAQDSRSWAGTAINGNVPAFISAVRQANKVSVRVGTNTNDSGKVKVVPRQLACFVGRLDATTTEEDLHEYLTSKGMKGVHCRKITPKNGRVYKTAAFKVTCCVESRHLFQDEACWPGGAELRDWVYYPRSDTNIRNGEQ